MIFITEAFDLFTNSVLSATITKTVTQPALIIAQNFEMFHQAVILVGPNCKIVIRNLQKKSNSINFADKIYRAIKSLFDAKASRNRYCSSTLNGLSHKSVLLTWEVVTKKAFDRSSPRKCAQYRKFQMRNQKKNPILINNFCTNLITFPSHSPPKIAIRT